MITNTPFRIVLQAKTNKNRKVKRLFALQKHSRSVVLMGSAVGIIERERDSHVEKDHDSIRLALFKGSTRSDRSRSHPNVAMRRQISISD